MPSWIKNKLFQKKIIINQLNDVLGNDVNWQTKLLFSEHHLSHAASAFFTSNFENAAVLTLDGVGEWATSSLTIGNGNKLRVIKEINFPHSLGLMYSAFTYYIGFKVNSGEYKVMGLAPYGKPKYLNLIKENLINIADDGSFQLDMSYFDFATGLTMTNKKFEILFNGPPRNKESELTQREMDIAASIQKVTEEILIKLVKDISKETQEKNLCLAGGVALNCVANGILYRKKIFDKIWIQPAAGDAGGALGAALCAFYLYHKKERRLDLMRDPMKGCFLGPSYNNQQIETELLKCNAKFIKLNEEDLIDRVASSLAEAKSVGWMQGRMEFGPRALGGRSIIADPRCKLMQRQLNLKIKYRESFRPFAPSILYENLDEWFEDANDSPYMLFVSYIKKGRRRKISKEEQKLFGIKKLNVVRSSVPAITHVDYSARIQTVHPDTNPRYHALISKFREKTGYPLIINTSFNVRGEPIVCSPTDAFKCFMGTELDILAIGNFFLEKENQETNQNIKYNEMFELD